MSVSETEVRNELKALADKAAAACAEAVPEHSHKLRALGKTALQRHPTRIMLVGQTKVGKSSLINALLSLHHPEQYEEYLPVGLVAETHTLWRVQHGPTFAYHMDYGHPPLSSPLLLLLVLSHRVRKQCPCQNNSWNCTVFYQKGGGVHFFRPKACTTHLTLSVSIPLQAFSFMTTSEHHL